ncbi:aminopeptidase P family protein [Rubrivirga sp.]|uniref:aminopeptidase P family protein n=1 Tax=Rubrivirga sp. TaxID=1885344 RepID=UPI003C74F2A6
MMDAATLAARRRTLAGALGGGVAVLIGNDPEPMNYPANHYGFRQDGSFRYYTGLDEPSLALVLDVESGESTLHGRESTLEDKVWDGETPTMAERAESAGIEHTAPVSDLEAAVRGMRAKGREVHVLPPYRASQRERLAGLLEVPASSIKPSDALVEAVIAQRILKTDLEVAEIEVAVGIAAEMHRTAMRLAQPGRTEFEVAAAIEAVAKGKGSYLSFPAIVTVRGEVPHHHASSHVLEAGDLLLHDAGCVAPGSGYCSDITRVSPVGGTFTDRQRLIYSVVLEAQVAAIEACGPSVSFQEVHRLSAATIAAGLIDIGLLRGNVDDIVEVGAHAAFYHHGLGHPMGLDVHDLEGLGEDRVGYGDEATRSTQFGTKYLRFARALRPGMVMTIEPGVYFNRVLLETWADEGRFSEFVDYDAAFEWVGFGGVRIEDDVLITEDGHRVLGPPIPKSLEDVEAVVQGR